MNENEAMVGADDALSVVKQVVSMGERFNLILDMRGYVFENLEAHKIWATEFRQHRLISENVGFVAVVGDAGPKLFAEKEMMETDVLKFFFDFNRAYEWLQNQKMACQK